METKAKTNQANMKGIFGIFIALFLVVFAVVSAIPKFKVIENPDEEFFLINSPRPPPEPLEVLLKLHYNTEPNFVESLE